MRYKVIVIPQSKIKGLKPKVLPSKRICIGARAGNDCNNEFQPKNNWMFLCDQCKAYITNQGD